MPCAASRPVASRARRLPLPRLSEASGRPRLQRSGKAGILGDTDDEAPRRSNSRVLARLLAAPPSAQAVDGKWTGKIGNGGNAGIEIASNAVQSCESRGKPVKVWNSRSFRDSITFTAANARTLILTKVKAKALDYIYFDTFRGTARTVLTRR